LWREHLHAATRIGRVAAAAKAVELGYAISAGEGRSGWLRHWRIAGVLEEVLALHSKRAGEITAAVEVRGTDIYQARKSAARATRVAKRHVPEGELLSRWRGELASIGWSPQRLAASIDAAAGSRIVAEPSLAELHRVLGVLLADDGALARQKVFARRHVLVELAPLVYGWDPRMVEGVAARVLADPEVVPLVGVAGAVEAVHALASVLAREEVIAERIATGIARSDAPTATLESVAGAVAETEVRVGGLLAVEQHRAVEKICSSGRGVELVVGVAGAGKTTMLAAVAAAFEASGCEVLGTATAGRAARTLAAGATLERSSTLASLTGRLEHGQSQLTERSVVILDAAGMTDDIDLARLVTEAQLAGAKLVVVGDHRQLGALGPGGALAALVAGIPAPSTTWSTTAARSTRGNATSWSSCVTVRSAGRSTGTRSGAGSGPSPPAATLSRPRSRGGRPTPPPVPPPPCWRGAVPTSPSSKPRARAWMTATGRLTGPELGIDGVAYRAGDRVVTLAPDHTAGLVTSQRATVTTVTTVDPDSGTISVRTDDDR